MRFLTIPPDINADSLLAQGKPPEPLKFVNWTRFAVSSALTWTRDKDGNEDPQGPVLWCAIEDKLLAAAAPGSVVELTDAEHERLQRAFFQLDVQPPMRPYHLRFARAVSSAAHPVQEGGQQKTS